MDIKEIINEFREVAFRSPSINYIKAASILDIIEKTDFLRLAYIHEAVNATISEFNDIVDEMILFDDEDRKRADFYIESIINYLEGLKIMNML